MSHYIVDLIPFGYIFKNQIKSILIETHTVDYEGLAEYIFRELNNQIMSVMEASHENYLLNILCFPDFRYFEYIPAFDDKNVQLRLAGHFREYALALFFLLHQKINIRPDCDYLMESVSDYHMVLLEVFKGLK